MIFKTKRYRDFAGISLFVLATSFSSCQKYFLDAEPQESVSDASAIVDASTAESALLGVYDKVQSSSYYGGDGYQAAATFREETICGLVHSITIIHSLHIPIGQITHC
jgi:hypothetical protein